MLPYFLLTTNLTSCEEEKVSCKAIVSVVSTDKDEELKRHYCLI